MEVSELKEAIATCEAKLAIHNRKIESMTDEGLLKQFCALIQFVETEKQLYVTQLMAKMQGTERKAKMVELIGGTPSKKSFPETKVNKLKEIIATLSKSSIVVKFGEKVYRSGEITSVLSAMENSAPDPDIRSRAEVKDVEEAQRRLHLKQVLSSGISETTAQKRIFNSSNLEYMNAVDTNSAAYHMFSMPRKVGKEDNIYPSSAKHDVISTLCPMALEVKVSPPTGSTCLVDTDVDGLTQALKRLFVVRSTNATLSTFVLFVVTGRSSWQLKFCRDLGSYSNSTEERPFEAVQIDRIAVETLFQLWFGYSMCSQESPQWYLTEDGPHILSTITSVTDPCLCGSQLLQSSGHRVYGISLPRNVSFKTVGGKSKSVVGVTMASHDFCVKVVHGQLNFEREAAAVSAVSKVFHEVHSDKSFHLIGVHRIFDTASNVPEMDAVVDVVQIELENIDMNAAEGEMGVETTADAELDEAPIPKDRELRVVRECAEFGRLIATHREVKVFQISKPAHVDSCAWRQLPPQESLNHTGGTIVMRIGKKEVLTPSNASDWLVGVYETLECVHKAGYLHCDIREANVLRFPKGFQLIDYDGAVQASKPSVTLQYGGQFDCRPPNLQSQQIGNTVEWQPYWDVLMAANCIVKVIGRLAPN